MWTLLMVWESILGFRCVQFLVHLFRLWLKAYDYVHIIICLCTSELKSNSHFLFLPLYQFNQASDQ